MSRLTAWLRERFLGDWCFVGRGPHSWKYSGAMDMPGTLRTCLFCSREEWRLGGGFKRYPQFETPDCISERNTLTPPSYDCLSKRNTPGAP